MNGSWPEAALDRDVNAPRLYDAGSVEDWVDLLVTRRYNLLLCGDDSTLDREAQSLLHGLRRAGNVETALLFEMDRQLLLERFNRLLAEISVEQARTGTASTVRVWVLQVQTDAELEQARLMLRLSHDLPGSGVVVLLMSSVRRGRELAPEGSSRRLQVRVIGDPWARPESPAAAVDGAAPPPESRTPLAPPLEAAGSKRPRASSRTAVVAGLALLTVSAGLVFWMRAAGDSNAEAGKTRLTSIAPPPVMTRAAEAEKTASTPAGASSVEQAAASAPESQPPGKDSPAPGTDMPAAGGKTLPSAAEISPPPREQTARETGWIDGQPDSSWLVQHAVSWRAGDLLDQRTRQPALAEARVVALFRSDGKIYYALVSGPFATAAEARSFEKDLPKRSTPAWVRSVARVKQELQDPARLAVPGLQPPSR
jgi:hypothetical protein